MISVAETTSCQFPTDLRRIRNSYTGDHTAIPADPQIETQVIVRESDANLRKAASRAFRVPETTPACCKSCKNMAVHSAGEVILAGRC